MANVLNTAYRMVGDVIVETFHFGKVGDSWTWQIYQTGQDGRTSLVSMGECGDLGTIVDRWRSGGYMFTPTPF